MTTDLLFRAAGMVSESPSEVEEAQEDDERFPVFGIVATVTRLASFRSDELGVVRRWNVSHSCGQMGNGDRSDINRFY